MSTEEFASSVTLFLDKSQDGVIAEPAVVLPHADSRQPQSDFPLGAEQPITPGVDSPQIGNLQTRLASLPPNKKIKTYHSGPSTSGGPGEGVIKRLRIRGTRGRGDPRNARMREDRLRARMAEIENFPSNSRGGLPPQAVALRNRGRPTYSDARNTEPRYGGFAYRNNQYGNFGHPKRAPAAERRTPQQQITIDIHGPPSSTGRRSNRFQRPPPLAMNRPVQAHQGPEHRRPENDWTQWIELGIKLSGLPLTVATFDLWQSFRHEGSIATVEIFEDSQGKRDGRGRIRFRYSTSRDYSLRLTPLADTIASPPPSKPFWQVARYQIKIKGVKQPYFVNVELEAKRRLFLAPSPVNPSVKYPETTVTIPLAIPQKTR